MLSLIILAMIGLSVYLMMSQRSTDISQYIIFEREVVVPIIATATTQSATSSQQVTPSHNATSEMLDALIEQQNR